MLLSFYRIIAFAWQDFWRNIWLSLVTITIIVLAFISVNFLVVLNVITDNAINIVKDKIDISVYFRQDITEPQVLEVQTYLSSLAQVKDIKYISQQQALKEFRQKHQKDTTIIESLEELEQNPLGATLIVKAKDIKDYPEIITVLDNSKYNGLILDKNFEDHKNYVNKIKELSDSINRIGFATSGIFIIIALLIVFNTIRVAIYTHRQEIGIMKLVGATNWFIQGPFLISSIFYGLVGCIISLAILFPLLNIIQPYLNNFFQSTTLNITDYFWNNLWSIFALEMLTITLLNIVGSLIAIRRYLRV